MAMAKDLLELVEDAKKYPIETEVEKVVEESKEMAARVQAMELISMGLTKVGHDLLRKVAFKARMRKIQEGKYVVIKPEHILKFMGAQRDEFNRAFEDRTEKLDQMTSKYTSHSTFDSWKAAFTGTGFIGNGLGGPSTILGANPLGQVPLQEQRWTSNSTVDPFSIPPTLRMRMGSFLPQPEASAFDMYLVSGDRLAWQEKRLEEYEAVPPADVLKKLADEKKTGLFDYMTIASVKLIHDPLLLGRIEGSENRYFLAQWGDDIKLDDLI